MMLTCLSRILVFCWSNHFWRSGQLFFVHCLMSVSGFRWWDHTPLLRIPGLVVGSWGSWFLLLVSFWSTADWSDQKEKWISGGKTFDMLCLFCRSYELICAWKGWLCFFMKATICFLISLIFRWTLNHIFTNNHVKI